MVKRLLLALWRRLRPADGVSKLREETSKAPLLERAEELKVAPPPEPMSAIEAVRILKRDAGQLVVEGNPPVRLVQEARRILKPIVVDYLDALSAGGNTIPSPSRGMSADEFAAFLGDRAVNDIDGWLDGLFSDIPVRVPKPVTDVLVQRAAEALGFSQPAAVRVQPAPWFAPAAERRMHVVETATGFPVLPQVTRRGDSPLVVVSGKKKFHERSATLSGWQFRDGGLGPLAGPGPEDDDGGDPPGDVLVPRGNHGQDR
ncbi:MAG TPA: hypothetical protein VGV41_17960 [Pseudolabrys sp.]|uniref:hypothetical protein n=1 Tax=Pseudolabrys sp. TaxID=1960880 RepID=UPI002DDCB85E|nr:hypothetical protein [Pseudolabrys sp.]HEV2630517.1 hypothetical protein [Pseudolabrys sp.]